MQVLNVIDKWISGLEHKVILKTFVMKIHCPQNPVLRIATYVDRHLLPDSGNLSLYSTIHYKWVGKRYKKSEEVWGEESPWVRHKHG